MYINLSTMQLIRYVVGYVFITSGLMKLLNDGLADYFVSLSLPYPTYLLYLVAILEVGCGILLIANKHVKNATIPLIIIIIAAILITKVPTLHAGLLQFAFNARLDIVILVLLVILYHNGKR